MIKLIYRYLLKQFIMTFLFATIALCLIFLMVSLMENLDDFLDQHASFTVIATYYLYFFPEIIKLMAPVSVLLATLFTVGKLSTTNEITAMKSSGISLYKIMMPFVIVATLISLGHLYFNGWLVPKATEIKTDIEEKYLKKGPTGTQIFNIYFRDTPIRNVIMHYYDAATKTGNGVSIEEYSDEKKPRLIKKYECQKMVWDDKRKEWKLYKAIIRNFNQGVIQTIVSDSTYYQLTITHLQISELKKETSEMNYNEFKNYIILMKQGGKDVRQLYIEYYGNYAFPFSNLIVVLFGVPFASIKKKGGIAVQIGAALVVSFLYIIFTKVGQTIGFYSNIDPIVTGWMANIIFFAGAMVVLFKTRT